jgi:hypothetical protein
MKIALLKISIVLLFILLASPAVAALLFFHSPSKEFGIGQEFKVDLLLNTEGESLNALEGKIIFPKDFLELKEIKDGNSIINLWTERPEMKESGRIVFSGIVPGGFRGENGFIFSAVFITKKSGLDKITLEGIRVLKNDGLGTKASARAEDFGLSVSAKTRIIEEPIEIRDSNPPEKFRPEIAQNQDIFDGRYFLVFATQDKQSGLNHYEVKEGFFGRFVLAESPYLLEDQRIGKIIYVKAVDKEGNQKIESLYPPKWYKENSIIVIIVVVFLAILLLFKRTLWKKFIK